VLMRIDVAGFTVPLTAVTLALPNVTIASDFAGVSYEGKLSADGKTMDGIWSQRAGPPSQPPQTYPVTFLLASAETLWKPKDALAPMAATVDPAYEIASIRVSQTEGPQWYMITRNRKFEAKNMPLKELIKFAYEIRGRQVEGGPAWVNDLRLDIQAEPDTAGLPSVAQHRAMCKKLLAERFGLTFHWTEKAFPTYELTVVKSSPALTRSDSDEAASQIFGVKDKDGDVLMRFEHTTMWDLAAQMMNFVQDRHILDETGLSGPYDFTLRLPAGMFDGPSPGEAAVDPAAAYSRAVEQLGLKMEAKKGSLPVLVIDHLDKPSAN